MPLIKLPPLRIDSDKDYYTEFFNKIREIWSAIVAPTKENCKTAAEISAELARRITVQKELETLRNNLTLLATELLNVRKKIVELENITDSNIRAVKQTEINKLTSTINTEIIGPLISSIRPYAQKHT